MCHVSLNFCVFDCCFYLFYVINNFFKENHNCKLNHFTFFNEKNKLTPCVTGKNSSIYKIIKPKLEHAFLAKQKKQKQLEHASNTTRFIDFFSCLFLSEGWGFLSKVALLHSGCDGVFLMTRICGR